MACPSSHEDIDTVRLFIHGFVQGVNYRRWLQGEALERGVHGWVRNRSDGTVEAILSGPARQVADLMRAARHGPSLARVDRVHSEQASYDGLEDFRVIDDL